MSVRATVLAAFVALALFPAGATAQTWLPCGEHPPTGRVVLKVRPARCDNGGFQTANAELWILQRLRWSSWGGDTARARGLQYAVHRYPGYTGRPVRVRAFHLSDACGAERPFYTRLQLTLPAWNRRSRPFSGGPWTVRRMPAVRYVVRTYPPDRC